MNRLIITALLVHAVISVMDDGFDFAQTRSLHNTDGEAMMEGAAVPRNTASKPDLVSISQVPFDNTDHGETTVIVENDGKEDEENPGANAMAKNKIANSSDNMEGYTIVLDNSNSGKEPSKEQNDINYRTLRKSFASMENKMQDIITSTRGSKRTNGIQSEISSIRNNRKGEPSSKYQTERPDEAQNGNNKMQSSSESYIDTKRQTERPNDAQGNNSRIKSSNTLNHEVKEQNQNMNDLGAEKPAKAIDQSRKLVRDNPKIASPKREPTRKIRARYSPTSSYKKQGKHRSSMDEMQSLSKGSSVMVIPTKTTVSHNASIGDIGEEQHQIEVKRTTTKNETSYKQQNVIYPSHHRQESVNNTDKIGDSLKNAASSTEGYRTVDNRTDIQNGNGTEGESGDRPGDMVVNPRKAQAMVEYLNKDPLESWIYHFDSLKALGINATMLRNGLVNAGSIDRLKEVMRRALKGEHITLSVVGGSISAGGGLYKDRGNIDGLYYKGIVDWWTKTITPLTGSKMTVNNIAIGSIGTDYFSYCLRNHILNNTDLIFWELSGNDYNRYVKQPTKGARPLERLTRVILSLPKTPALIFVNFFKGIDYKTAKTKCPNFEDQGEDIIAHYYRVPSLSWRAMVCENLIAKIQLFTMESLFSNDENHPSLRGHAQMALLLILHIRHVMRAVLQWAIDHEGYAPNFSTQYIIPPPLFIGLDHPDPLCWTLISPDPKEQIYNSLPVRVMKSDGFKMEYATNFPIRYDRVICWKSEKEGAELALQFDVPKINRVTGMQRSSCEVAITSHSRWYGKADVWLDNKTKTFVAIQEGRTGDTGKRTQVDVLVSDLETGQHTLHIRSVTAGFCLSSIMIQ